VIVIVPLTRCVDVSLPEARERPLVDKPPVPHTTTTGCLLSTLYSLPFGRIERRK